MICASEAISRTYEKIDKELDKVFMKITNASDLGRTWVDIARNDIKVEYQNAACLRLEELGYRVHWYSVDSISYIDAVKWDEAKP